MVKAQINSEKHILELGPGTVASAAILVQNLAVVSATHAVSNEVREGSTIKAIYIELWVTSDDAAQGNSQASFEKRPSGSPALTFAQSQALNSYPNKKNLFEVHRGLIASNVRNPTPFFSKWIAVPKGKQRMGLGDLLVLNLNGIANGVSFCGMALYKEYF